MMSSRPLCAARCSAVKCWLSYEFGFAFPLVNNVWEKKNGSETTTTTYSCCSKRLTIKKDAAKMRE